MNKDHLLAVAAGAVAGLFYLTIGSTMPAALILVQLPLFAMGLGWGLTAALIAGASATVIVLAALPAVSAMVFVLTSVLPVLVLTGFALQSRRTPGDAFEWYPPGYLLSWLAALTLAYLVGAAAYFSGEADGLRGASREFLHAALGVMLGDAQPERLAVFVDVVARFLPATVLAFWQLMVIASGVLAQSVLTRFGRNMRPGAPFAGLELPGWSIIVLAVCGAAALTPGGIGYLGQNGAVVMAIPFFFLGLSVIHALARRWRGRRLVLSLVYMLMIILGWPAVLVAGLGIVEPWVRLRGRRSGPRADQEEE